MDDNNDKDVENQITIWSFQKVPGCQFFKLSVAKNLQNVAAVGTFFKKLQLLTI